MKIKRFSLLVCVLSGLSFTVFSQDEKMLDSIPQTKEEFVRSEKAVINTINWLENTPVDQQTDLRNLRKAQVVAWITKSPTVTIEVNANVVDFFKKNPELLIIFMGGWTRYSLEHAYSSDPVQCNRAGIESAIRVYKMGIGMKKDKEMEKLADMETKGTLEQWIKDQLAKK
jgi:hypothetical protein